jgi:hypothetical protein
MLMSTVSITHRPFFLLGFIPQCSLARKPTSSQTRGICAKKEKEKEKMDSAVPKLGAWILRSNVSITDYRNVGKEHGTFSSYPFDVIPVDLLHTGHRTILGVMYETSREDA